MPAPLIGAIAAPLAGAAAGKLFGPKQPKAQAAVPQDLNPLRQQQIQLLQWLTGFGGQPQGMAGGQPTQPGGMGGPSVGQMPGGVNFGGQSPLTAMPPVTPDNPYGFNADQLAGTARGGGGKIPTGGGLINQMGPTIQPPNLAGGGGAAGSAIGQYFGPLGVPGSGLQNSAAQSAQRMLTQQTPQQRALEAAQPFVGQTGLNADAIQRLGQGATQSGVNPGVQNFFGNLLQNTPQIGPGADVASILRSIGQTGGLGGQGPGGSILSQLQALGQTGGGAAGSGAEGFLQRILAQNPALANQALLQPQFQRNLDLANQTGGRFGTANAVMRGNVVADQNANLANLLQQGTGQQIGAAGALGQLAQAQRATQLQAQLQALGLGSNLAQAGVQNQLGAAGQLGGFNQQGQLAGLQAQLQGAGNLGQLNLADIGQQLQAASTMGNLGLAGQQNLLQSLGLQGQLAQNAGNADLANTQQAFNIGTQQAGQADIENQRRLQILLSMLGVAQGAAFNQPTITSPSGAQQGAALGGGIANTLTSALPWLLGQQRGTPAAGPAGSQQG